MIPLARIALLLLATSWLCGTASADPRIDYMLECQGCHLPDGRGKPGAVPSLRDSVARFATLPEGRAFLVAVPGSALSRLDDAALAGVLNWMLVEFGPAEAAASAVPFDAGEVGRLRASPLIDVDTVRRALVAQLGRGAEGAAAGVTPAR